MPRVIEDDDVDLSDVDNFKTLTSFERTLVVLEQVREEHGPVSMDDICIAELHSLYWAINRRRRLAAIHQARSMKKRHQLSHDGRGTESLARRGLRDVNAAREYFGRLGIPVVDAIQ